MGSVKIKETMGDWYSVERDFIAVITGMMRQVSILGYKLCKVPKYICNCRKCYRRASNSSMFNSDGRK